MERIIIEVDDITAKKWKYISTELRQKLAGEFRQIMKATLDKSEDEFWPFLEKVRKNAERKGFNDDVLTQILGEK